MYHFRYVNVRNLEGARIVSDGSQAVAFVSSSGGVLPDVLAVANNWPVPVNELWIAPKTVDTEAKLGGRQVLWLDEPEGRPAAMLRATAAARTTLQERNIEWLASAGTAIALPFFLAAQSLGVSTLWIETLNIHGGHGRVAEVCSRLATRTLVQSPDRLLSHRRALLIGELQ